jgi:predicted GH43/DUF377 family glycosyl hydrolase
MSFLIKKMGLVFDPTQHANRPNWMVDFAQAPNVLIFDSFVRVFFCCRPAPDENGQFVSYSAFVDLDRHNLFNILNIASQPLLQLGNLGEFDEFGTYPFSVTRDGDDIIAIYGGWTRCESVPFDIALGLARSKNNGVSFKKYGSGPILSHSPNEPFTVTSPKIRRYGGTWYLAYTAGQRWIRADDGRAEIVYKIRIARSSDCVNWTKLDRDIIESKLGVDEAQACPDIIYVNGTYHMFFCYRHGLDFRSNKNNTYRIGYARSDDLICWQRDDSRINLEVSESGWDSEMVAYPTVFQLDGCTYMLYAGNGVGKTGFGLARFEGELV